MSMVGTPWSGTWAWCQEVRSVINVEGLDTSRENARRREKERVRGRLMRQRAMEKEKGRTKLRAIQTLFAGPARNQGTGQQSVP